MNLRSYSFRLLRQSPPPRKSNIPWNFEAQHIFKRSLHPALKYHADVSVLIRHWSVKILGVIILTLQVTKVGFSEKFVQSLSTLNSLINIEIPLSEDWLLTKSIYFKNKS